MTNVEIIYSYSGYPSQSLYNLYKGDSVTFSQASTVINYTAGFYGTRTGDRSSLVGDYPPEISKTDPPFRGTVCNIFLLRTNTFTLNTPGTYTFQFGYYIKYQTGDVATKAGSVTINVISTTPDIPVNVSGSWKNSNCSVNVNGAWKEIDSAYVNINGAWKEI